MSSSGKLKERELSLADGMEFTRRYLPSEWEERWRREKERRKRMMEDSGEEGIEQDERELRRIVAYNDSRMGLMSGGGAEVRARGATQERTGELVNQQALWSESHDHIYSSETYPRDVFTVLKEFWDSSVLTDLTLITRCGKRFQVHSLVLAAVSSFIRERLTAECREGSDGDEDLVVGVKWVTLGPEVDPVGLKAVVEFAYTGAVLSVNEDGIALVKAAAQALGVHRLLDLNNKNKRMTEIRASQEEEQHILPTEEMKITLQSMKNLWAERVSCDVTLDVGGALFDGQ